MNLGYAQEDFKYFRNKQNLFENPDYWINNNAYIKRLKAPHETLAFEKFRKKLFYQNKHQTIERFINYNLEGHSRS